MATDIVEIAKQNLMVCTMGTAQTTRKGVTYVVSYMSEQVFGFMFFGFVFFFLWAAFGVHGAFAKILAGIGGLAGLIAGFKVDGFLFAAAGAASVAFFGAMVGEGIDLWMLI